jgi:sigma-E factor negative regulatory protein RseA
MVMSERISSLVDGELEAADFDVAFGELRSRDAVATWVCYHVIGDHLRGTGCATSRIATRLATALAAEPTVLAPAASSRARASQPAAFAWAVAATLAAVTVVGWTAFSMVDVPPTAVAKAREASSVRVAQVKPPGVVPPDYLLAHEEFSPTMALQGVGPYLRAVAAPAPGTESKP